MDEQTRTLDLVSAATQPTGEVLEALGTTAQGLASAQAAERLTTLGPNAVRTHHAQALRVLGRQLRSAILILLAVTATLSAFLGDHTDALIIGVILLASVGLGFVNEYRAERATEALHSRVKHVVTVLRDGHAAPVDVVELVPGDVVHLALGNVVPADLRLLTVTRLECDESILTGESLPVGKQAEPVAAGAGVGDLTSCALMGTIVRAGSGTGVVVATGPRAQFGQIALALGDRQPETDFQKGLRSFSMLLLKVALVLTSLILVTNLLLERSLIESVLFSLAIAVGITPQLLPAVVSTSLATGSRLLAARKVLVKRLVCIEDLGDVDILVTDKTGTLTEGQISLLDGLGPDGSTSAECLLGGLLASDDDPLGANQLDAALQDSPLVTGLAADRHRRLAGLPFDHDRRVSAALVEGPDGKRQVVAKGAAESLLAGCTGVSAATTARLEQLYAAGRRVVAVASKPVDGTTLGPEDLHDLRLLGFLVFLDRPKAAARESLARLSALGIEVKVATGDHPVVAEKVWAELGLVSRGTLTGADVDRFDDEALAERAAEASIFARISPQQKARLVRVLRTKGRSVAFLGDGVNDALALHAADVGISVDTATDVAKDAADVVLLEKDLDVLAEGVAQGRRIFANTIKYVLMGTSSNFGNMFSAAAASAVLSFLPMLPSQILLNNLLYDSSQLALPTDRVDAEQLRAPAHWDVGFIRRFMLFFGPISSLFDFVTFALLLGAFHAGPGLFRAGWFTESLATQTLVIFVIRTRRSPFTRSRPSLGLTVAAACVVVIGAILPLSPLRHVLGFARPSAALLVVLAVMVLVYLGLIELAKRVFYAEPHRPRPVERRRGVAHRVQRRAARFSAVSARSLRRSVGA